ncbi:Rossmann-like and DUF2520 domain-containing protein [Nocardiopsis kunsanensis]|uniref:DUF2520 domain-containing protein n=1 Tax=Nocardiopsis kunsanensis TaxID=141693 RepID=A0A919CIB0_9ACTN|nr:DUF2520 domain-containing protein [Nocardiopsis kunsanensis]GHD27987.1 hypothetical protein GCM10007147_27540 [Nocardiopsis kunsanensis]
MESTQGRPARLRVGVIGPGRVGSVLAQALGRAGHKVVAAAAVSERSRSYVEERLPGARLMEPAQVVEASDLVLLTVPDDALADVAEGLAETGTDLRGTILVHAGGAHGYGVLAPATVAGALPLALHPAMTFTGRDEDIDRLADCAFGVTAPEQLRPIAEALVVEMGAEPVWIAEDKRTLYHAALAGGANHLVTLVADSAGLLQAAGVPEPGRMLAPMLSAALDNALRLGIHGLSGPVLRGDSGTVAGHIEQLRDNAPESVASYVELARLTADRAITAGLLKPEDAARLLDVLRR